MNVWEQTFTVLAMIYGVTSFAYILTQLCTLAYNANITQVPTPPSLSVSCRLFLSSLPRAWLLPMSPRVPRCRGSLPHPPVLRPSLPAYFIYLSSSPPSLPTIYI